MFVTINIDDSVHDKWLAWMMEKHIPEMMETGKFYKAKIVKVLVVEEMGGTTYSIQYFTESKDTLESYYKEDAPPHEGGRRQAFWRQDASLQDRAGAVERI